MLFLNFRERTIMKMFQRTQSQHEGTLTFMRNHVDTMVSEGTISQRISTNLHFSINQYHAQNNKLSLPEFYYGLCAHISEELLNSSTHTTAARLV